MTALELRETLDEIIDRFGGDMEVWIAYQPHWPLACQAGGIKTATGGYGHGGDRKIYIYESCESSGEYAPESIYDEPSPDGEIGCDYDR